MVNDDRLYEKPGFHQNAVGIVLSLFDSWPVMRGVKTLTIRMKKH